MTKTRIIRVFPRRTSYTPTDDYAFVGYPPMIRPEAREVRISVAFTWDKREAARLYEAWRQYYPRVRVGGPAYGYIATEFTPGMFVKRGVTFTTRGCRNNCKWCLVPEREGKLVCLDTFAEGHIIQDNNFLQAPKAHRLRVYEMLRRQKRAAIFAGGLEAALVSESIADELRSIRIDHVFLAADTDLALKPLATALERLSFLGDRRKLRVYALCGYGSDAPDKAVRRLEAIWALGGMPFAQLWQPPDRWIEYNPEWRALARTWSRPAVMMAMHKEVRVDGSES